MKNENGDKICSNCKKLGEFYNNSYWCKECYRVYYIEKNKTVEGKVSLAWYRIQTRALNRSGNHPEYKDVECRISKEEFIKWGLVAYKIFMENNPNEVPSTDRINGGHYETGNLQVLSWGDNARKTSRNKNLCAPEGMSWCSWHDTFENTKDFYLNKSRGIPRYMCKKAYAEQYELKKIMENK